MTSRVFLVSAELLVLSTVVSCPNACSGSTFGVMSFIAHRSAVAVVFLNVTILSLQEAAVLSVRYCMHLCVFTECFRVSGLFCFRFSSYSCSTSFSLGSDLFQLVTVCHLLDSRYFQCAANFLVFLTSFKSRTVILAAVGRCYLRAFTILIIMCFNRGVDPGDLGS